MLGVNDRVELARVRALAQRRIHEAHMRAGVTIVDPATTHRRRREHRRRHRDRAATLLRGATTVGERCIIGPLTTLIDSALGDGVTVLHSYLTGCEVRAGGTVGPFAYLRPARVLREGAKAGTFVEIKNSDIGEGTKVPHLSYIGDADVGPGTQPRRRDDHRQLRRPRASTARRSARVRTRSTRRSSRRSPSATTPTRAPARSSPTTSRPARSAIARERQTNIEGYAERARRAATRARRHDRDVHLAMAMSAPDAAGAGDQPPDRLRQAADAVLRPREPELAAQIADKLGVDLGPVTLKTFSNGEVYCRYEESIRGADVFLIQPTCGNPATGVTANDALMELL